MVSALADVPEFLREHSLTITGGLNLAKAPWNNTTLSSIVAMVHRLRTGPRPLGGVHANASLGYQQGFLLLTS